MPPRPNVLPPLASVALICLLSAAPAAAADCWATTRAPAATGFGDPIAKPAYARLKAATERAEAALRADPRLSGIPDVRLQANRAITLPTVEGGAFTASTWVGLHGPKVWAGPGCGLNQGAADYVLPASVTVSFNTPSDIHHALEAAPGAGGSPGFPLAPEAAEAFRRSGIIAFNGAAVRALAADGGPAITPLTVREHLAFWEAELARIGREGGGAVAEPELAALRAHRGKLSAADLEKQAAMSAEAAAQHLWGYARPGEPESAPLFQIAPRLLEPVRDPGAVHLIVAAYSIADPDIAPEARLRAWLAAFDFSPWIAR